MDMLRMLFEEVCETKPTCREEWEQLTSELLDSGNSWSGIVSQVIEDALSGKDFSLPEGVQ